MNTKVKVTKNFNLGKIKLDLSKEINDFGKIIRKDHYQRLERGLGVDGSPMQKLSPGTIAKKGHSKILVDSGNMRNLVFRKKATAASQSAILTPGEKRKYPGTKVTPSQVGSFHQEGGLNLPKRQWFGISKKAEEDGEKRIIEKIKQEIDNA